MILPSSISVESFLPSRTFRFGLLRLLQAERKINSIHAFCLNLQFLATELPKHYQNYQNYQKACFLHNRPYWQLHIQTNQKVREMHSTIKKIQSMVDWWLMLVVSEDSPCNGVSLGDMAKIVCQQHEWPPNLWPHYRWRKNKGFYNVF